MTFPTIISFVLGLALLYIIGLLLVIPIRILIKLIVNGLIGGVLLFIFNIIGGLFGLGITINPLNAIIVGFLGVPGVVLILILQWIL